MTATNVPKATTLGKVSETAEFRFSDNARLKLLKWLSGGSVACIDSDGEFAIRHFAKTQREFGTALSDLRSDGTLQPSRQAPAVWRP